MLREDHRIEEGLLADAIHIRIVGVPVDLVGLAGSFRDSFLIQYVGHGQDLGMVPSIAQELRALEQISELPRKADQIEVCDLGLTAKDENEVLPERLADRRDLVVS